MTAGGPWARPRVIRPSQLSEPAVTDPDPGQHLRLWEATSLAMESVSRGGDQKRLLLPIASCLQGTILAPTSARLATAGSVAHSHATFWLSAAAATGSGAKYIRVTKIASIETNTALPEARTHQTYVPGGTRHGDHSRHGGHGDSMASDVAFQGGGAGPGRDRYRRAC
jgi:hypothetical protein